MTRYRTHDHAIPRRASAIAAAKGILGLQLREEHRVHLLKSCIWLATVAEPVHKHRTRYRSRAALESSAKVQHEHVVQQRTLVRALLKYPEKADELLACAVACTVTREEHDELTRLSRTIPQIDGWYRYVELSRRKPDFIVIDTSDGSVADVNELACYYWHPLLEASSETLGAQAADPVRITAALAALGIEKKHTDSAMLRHRGKTLQLYLKQSPRGGTFFAASSKRYSGFDWASFWTVRSDPGASRFIKVAPRTGLEHEALSALLQFFGSTRKERKPAGPA